MMDLIFAAIFLVLLVACAIMVAASAIGYELERNGLYVGSDSHVYEFGDNMFEDDQNKTTYCVKDGLCEAVRADSDRIPDWMNDGFFTVQILPIRQISCRIDGKEVIARGDEYIVKTRGGDVFVITNQEFNRMFIKAKIIEEVQ